MNDRLINQHCFNDILALFLFVDEIFALQLIICASAIVCKHYFVLQNGLIEMTWFLMKLCRPNWILLKNEFSHSLL